MDFGINSSQMENDDKNLFTLAHVKTEGYVRVTEAECTRDQNNQPTLSWGPKIAAERCREYRERKRKAENNAQVYLGPKTAAERCRAYRERKKQAENKPQTRPPPKTSTERVQEFRKRRREQADLATRRLCETRGLELETADQPDQFENDTINLIKDKLVGGTLKLQSDVMPHKFKSQVDLEEKLLTGKIQSKNYCKTNPDNDSNNGDEQAQTSCEFKEGNTMESNVMVHCNESDKIGTGTMNIKEEIEEDPTESEGSSRSYIDIELNVPQPLCKEEFLEDIGPNAPDPVCNEEADNNPEIYSETMLEDSEQSEDPLMEASNESTDNNDDTMREDNLLCSNIKINVQKERNIHDLKVKLLEFQLQKEKELLQMEKEYRLEQHKLEKEHILEQHKLEKEHRLEQHKMERIHRFEKHKLEKEILKYKKMVMQKELAIISNCRRK